MAFPGEQVLDDVRLVAIEAERVERNVHHGLQRTMRIAVDGDEEIILRRRSPVEKNPVVLGEQKREVPVELQRAVLVPDAVQGRDLATRFPRNLPVAYTDLEFLGMKVLLASRAQRIASQSSKPLYIP